ncbi:MAG: glutamate--tRNA ligase [Tannerellaceae bacterium]|jgi:glutamyl-tRNA synthetase|nr:glutamate--tRNA ligase [Tannerellaceae bacterium]
MSEYQKKVRVRFAPSPTGMLHIGGARTALYNYLFARQHGGTFLLRIEDTDTGRFVEGAEEYIFEALDWLGIKPDEPPVRQSARKRIYEEYVRLLLDNEKAYIAFDTAEELEAKRKETPNFQYDASTRMMMRNSLTLKQEDTQRLIETGHPYTVRIRIKPERIVTVNDLIRGEVKVNTSTLDDKVLWKSSDGMPTYHLANVVDDHLMGITHVIRGEEWLPSAPLHMLLYHYLKWEATMPTFAHLSLLLKPEGNGKLSKRDGERLGFPVFVLDYRERGYLPQAVVNFVALLGWNPGDDREVMSMEELIRTFDLSRCSRSGAKFDYEKAKWFNRQYLQSLSDAALADAFLTILKKKGVMAERDKVMRVVRLMKERIHFVNDLCEEAGFFFCAPMAYDEKTVKKRWKSGTSVQLREIASVLQNIDVTTPLAEEKVKEWIADKGYSIGDVMNALRLALVGEGKGPHLFEIIALLGKEETVQRIESCIACLSIPTSS